MNLPLLLCGLAIWAAATVALRLGGQYILRPGQWATTAIVFAVTFPLMAWVMRRLCRRAMPRREDWPRGAVSVLLPTLLLDPFSSWLFPFVFPNMAPQVAGAFGGWMLWCCAGALVGVTVGGDRRP